MTSLIPMGEPWPRHPVFWSASIWCGPWRGIVLALALLALALTGCAENDEAELEGPFGSGSGGTAVGALTFYALNKADGSPLGSMQADAVYFTPTLLDTIPSFVNLIDGIALDVNRISGLPETPCRFAAAVLARDQGFVILASGDRTNGNGLEFHQVDLVNGSTYVSFYCTTIRDNVGLQITGTSLNGNKLGFLQVHAVLNSVNR